MTHGFQMPFHRITRSEEPGSFWTMCILIGLLSVGPTAVALSARADPAPATAKTMVARLLDAIRLSDEARYAELAPNFVVMLTPDFGAPASWQDARKTFGTCSLTSLSDPKPLDSVPAHILTGTMTCGAPWPEGELTFDFLVDGKQVWGVYPGGINRFHPKLRNGTNALP